MMTFREQTNSDLSVFFNTDEFGIDVLYNDGSGPSAIIGSVDYGVSGSSADHATIMVQKSDVPSPAYRQTFTIGDDVWKINAEKGNSIVVAEDEDTFTLSIRKDERLNSWRP